MADMMDVKYITLDWRGIVHIVASWKSNWAHTLCGDLLSGGVCTEWPLKPRVCADCRRKLKSARVSEQGKVMK